YALKVKTSDHLGAGTDANITFTLTGEAGTASVTVDSSWIGEMERDDTNYVFLHSPDLGRLKTITVKQDGTGGRWGNALGWGSKWDVDWIEVRSAYYIGAGDRDPADRTKSPYMYLAEFGKTSDGVVHGQTINDNDPVTVDLESGVPHLGTLTNGDLV